MPASHSTNVTAWVDGNKPSDSGVVVRPSRAHNNFVTQTKKRSLYQVVKPAIRRMAA